MIYFYPLLLQLSELRSGNIFIRIVPKSVLNSDAFNRNP